MTTPFQNLHLTFATRKRWITVVGLSMLLGCEESTARPPAENITVEDGGSPRADASFGDSKKVDAAGERSEFCKAVCAQEDGCSEFEACLAEALKPALIPCLQCTKSLSAQEMCVLELEKANPSDFTKRCEARLAVCNQSAPMDFGCNYYNVFIPQIQRQLDACLTGECNKLSECLSNLTLTNCGRTIPR